MTLFSIYSLQANATYIDICVLKMYKRNKEVDYDYDGPFRRMNEPTTNLPTTVQITHKNISKTNWYKF